MASAVQPLQSTRQVSFEYETTAAGHAIIIDEENPDDMDYTHGELACKVILFV